MLVNGGRNSNGPKVGICTALVKSSYMLESLSISGYELTDRSAVKISECRQSAGKIPIRREILRGHTLDIRKVKVLPNKEMVPSAWRHAGSTFRKELIAQQDMLSKTVSEIPCRLNTDPHERRNDSGTVSTRNPVKL